jgi:hypothetical protein
LVIIFSSSIFPEDVKRRMAYFSRMEEQKTPALHSLSEGEKGQVVILKVDILGKAPTLEDKTMEFVENHKWNGSLSRLIFLAREREKPLKSEPDPFKMVSKKADTKTPKPMGGGGYGPGDMGEERKGMPSTPPGRWYEKNRLLHFFAFGLLHCAVLFDGQRSP